MKMKKKLIMMKYMKKRKLNLIHLIKKLNGVIVKCYPIQLKVIMILKKPRLILIEIQILF